MISNIFGKVLLGALNDKIGPLPASTISAAFLIGGMVMFLAAQLNHGLLIPAGIVYGLGFGLFNVEPPVLARSIFGGGKSYSNILSFIMMSGTLITAIGIPMLGFITSSTGDFRLIFYIGIACAVLALIFIYLAKGLGKNIIPNAMKEQEAARAQDAANEKADQAE
jgi:MFS family permease